MIESIDIVEIKRPSGWSPIRRELGVRSFGINAWSGDEGARLVGEHDEKTSGQEELYLVLSGSALFTVDGEELEAEPGRVVFVRDPASKRTAVASADGTVVLSVGGKPGEAFEPRVWEVNAEVFALFANDQVEEAKEMVIEALTRFEERSALTYNLACCESRLGETEEAITHLGEALAMRPSFAELAREDSDLDAIRDDPRFAALVAEPVSS
jgi:quercetin dioxygenase-like cupin family protein